MLSGDWSSDVCSSDLVIYSEMNLKQELQTIIFGTITQKRVELQNGLMNKYEYG